MLTLILVYVIILYVLEVVFGSSVDVYNAEIGIEASCGQGKRLSQKQFFGQLLPMALLCTGGLYLVLHLFPSLL